MPGDPLGILTPKKSTGTSDPLGILGNQNQPIQQTETIADINAKYGIDPTLTENQKAQINLQKTAEATKKKQEDDIHDAAVNTAKVYFENRPLELKGFGLSPQKQKDEFSLSNAGKKDKFSLSQLKNVTPFQQKVAELKSKVKSGTLITATGNDGKLIVARPAGKWEDAKKGISDAWYANDRINHYNSLSEDEQIKYLEEHKPDEYLPVKNDTESASYAAGGVIPMVGKMATGAAAGALIAASIPATGGLDVPVAAGGASALGAWMATVPDMAKQGQFNAEQEAYHKILQNNPDIDKKEALKKAKEAGVVGYAEGLATGTAMNFLGQGSIPEGTGQGLWKAAGQFLKNQPQSMAEIGGLSALSSVAADETKKALGVPITSGEMWDKAGKSMNSGAIMQLAFNVAHGVMSAPKFVKAQSNEVLTKVDPQTLQKLQEDAVNSGQLSQEQVDATNKDLQDYKAARAKIPESQTHDEERTAVIAGLIQKKANLEKAKTNVDKSYHKEIDDQIEAANQRIELAKNSPDPIKYAESDDVDGSINFTPKDYQSLSKAEKEGVVVPKDYGEAEVVETGEGENKKYTPKATFIEKQGGLEIKRTISIEGESFSDKSKAQDAADNALREHFYENGLMDNLKPEKKSAVTVIRPAENKPTEIVDKVQLPDNAKEEIKTEIPVEQAMAGSEPNNEPVIAEESGNAETIVPENVQPTGEAQTEQPIAEPAPVVPNIHVQHPPTQLSYQGTGKIETEFGIEQRPETIVKHDIETIKEADNLLADGWDVKKALNKIENEGHTPSDAEHINLVRYAAELGKRLRGIKDVSSPEYDQTLAELNRVAKASNVAGKEQGRALGIRGRFKTVADGTYEDYMLNELNSNNDAPLTDNQKATALKEFTELEKNKATFEDKTKALEDAVAQDKAANEFENTKKATKKAAKKTHEDFVKDRASIIEAAKEKIRKAKEAANSPDAPQRAGFGGRTKADDLFTIAPEVLKLVRSYAEEGVSKLADIIKEIHPIFKDKIENLSERDIHDIIAGEYNTKKITKNEAAKRMEDLRIEAALINKLERLQNGVEPKNEKAKIKRNQEIEELQKKIKDFNKENPDRAAQLNQIKARNEKETARIKEKIAKGDFAPDEKKIPLTQDPAIKAKYPNLIKDVKKSQDDLLKTKREIELRRLRQAYLNRTPNEKFTERLTKGANVPRTIMASMDFSAPLRQGLVASVSNPKLAARAAKFMFEAAKDEKVYNRWIDDVHNSEIWDTASKSGLAVTDPSTLHLKDKEEAFLGGEYAERIPIAGSLIKGSERAYVGFLNKMRWDLFNQYADAFEAKGQTYDNHPELYKGLASFVNSSTGRGGMAFGEAASPIMSSVLFSPRLIASRMNMLGLTDIPNVVLSGANKVAEGVTGGKFKPDWKVNYGFYSSLPKEIRIAAAKDMLRFVAAGITTLALAKYGFGAEVENDPRSSDFGKIKSGNTRWDIWGGFQPYARVLSQIVAGQTKSTNTGKIYDLDGKTLFSKDRTDPLTSFARGKLAPIPSAAWDLIKGKDIVGNDVSVSSELVNHLLPLIGQDVYSAMQDRGISALFTAGVPSVFGVGVQTYKPSDAAIGSLTKEQLKNPVWKFVTDVNLPTPSASKNSIPVPVDDKHPEGHMTDEEFKKFFKAKTDFIEQKIKEGISNGFTITTETEDSSNPVYTPASKLSKEERKDVMEKISREATIEAKKQFPKLFPKATEKKTIEINEYQ